VEGGPLEETITIVMPYYENGGMLDRHIQEWNLYPVAFKPYLKAVIVDDGSPKDPAIRHIQDVGFPIRLYRIKEDVAWGQDRARNLAMKHTEGLCLLTDMDHLLPVDCLKNLFSLKWSKDTAYRPLRKKVGGDWYKRHPNTYLLYHKLYWKVGGMDEAFLGWYGSDSVFKRALKHLAKVDGTDAFWLVLYGRDDIKDASTNPETYGRKKSSFAVCRNPKLLARRKKQVSPLVTDNYEWERLL